MNNLAYALPSDAVHEALSRPLRILFAANFPASVTSGIGNHLTSLAAALGARGHAVELLWSDSFPEIARQGAISRLTFPIALARWIRQEARMGRRFDAVNVHEPSGMWCTASRKLLKDFPPVVVTSHGLERRAWKLESQNKRLGWKSRIVYPLTQLLQGDFSLKHADRIAVLSSDDCSYLTLRLGVSADRIEVLGNGVHPQFLELRWAPSNAPRLLFIGTWIPRKGTGFLANLFHRLREDRPALEMCLAGTGLSEKDVLSSFPVEDRNRISVIPRVSRQQLFEILSRDQILLLPSSFEGMPPSVLEAMAAGLPCVTSDTCGMKELIAHGKTGFRVPLDDRSWLKQVAALLESADLRMQIGKAAREEARSRTWDHVAVNWEAMFARAAGCESKVAKSGHGQQKLSATEGPKRFSLLTRTWHTPQAKAPQGHLVDLLIDLSHQEGSEKETAALLEGWRQMGVAGKVLDVGCGAGRKVQIMNQWRGTTAFGCDMEIKLLSFAAQKQIPRLAASWAEALPFASHSFDWVTASEVIEHLEEPAKFLREVHRVLRPGGRVLLTTPNRLQYFRPWRPKMFWLAIQGRIVVDESHFKEFSARELKRSLTPYFGVEQVGFRGTLCGKPVPIEISQLPKAMQNIWGQGITITAVRKDLPSESQSSNRPAA